MKNVRLEERGEYHSGRNGQKTHVREMCLYDEVIAIIRRKDMSDEQKATSLCRIVGREQEIAMHEIAEKLL